MFLATVLLKQALKCLKDITTKLLHDRKSSQCVVSIVSPEFHVFTVLSFVF